MRLLNQVAKAQLPVDGSESGGIGSYSLAEKEESSDDVVCD